MARRVAQSRPRRKWKYTHHRPALSAKRRGHREPLRKHRSSAGRRRRPPPTRIDSPSAISTKQPEALGQVPGVVAHAAQLADEQRRRRQVDECGEAPQRLAHVAVQVGADDEHRAGEHHAHRETGSTACRGPASAARPGPTPSTSPPGPVGETRNSGPSAPVRARQRDGHETPRRGRPRRSGSRRPGPGNASCRFRLDRGCRPTASRSARTRSARAAGRAPAVVAPPAARRSGSPRSRTPGSKYSSAQPTFLPSSAAGAVAHGRWKACARQSPRAYCFAPRASLTGAGRRAPGRAPCSLFAPRASLTCRPARLRHAPRDEPGAGRRRRAWRGTWFQVASLIVRLAQHQAGGRSAGSRGPSADEPDDLDLAPRQTLDLRLGRRRRVGRRAPGATGLRRTAVAQQSRRGGRLHVRVEDGAPGRDVADRADELLGGRVPS